VDGEVRGSVYEVNEEPFNGLVSLLRCPACHSGIVSYQEFQGGENVYGDASRVWPEPTRPLDWSIPEIVRTSLNEAEKCLRASAYMASVVMCGRALEGICRHFETKSPYLGGGLSELRDREIIDKQLFQWSQELQKHRNIAAHASEKKIAKRDAEDLMDFVFAISEYIFVLKHKFEQFLKRKEDPAKSENKVVPAKKASW